MLQSGRAEEECPYSYACLLGDMENLVSGNRATGSECYAYLATAKGLLGALARPRLELDTLVECVYYAPIPNSYVPPGKGLLVCTFIVMTFIWYRIARLGENLTTGGGSPPPKSSGQPRFKLAAGAVGLGRP